MIKYIVLGKKKDVLVGIVTIYSCIKFYNLYNAYYGVAYVHIGVNTDVVI